MNKKCIVKDCKNLEYDPNYPDLIFSHGEFVGNYCTPCFEYIVNKKGKTSQAYRNYVQSKP